MGKYNVIYADPPWSYSNFQGKGSYYGDVSRHYKTLSLDELKELPIKELANENCVMFMWATFPNLKEAIELLEHWGFKYKTTAFVWVKVDKTGRPRTDGLGFYTNSNAEIVLIGKRGKLVRESKSVKQIVMAQKRGHSRKPQGVYVRIEEMYGNVPRIELFARNRREGWDAWGDEVPDETQMLLKEVKEPTQKRS